MKESGQYRVDVDSCHCGCMELIPKGSAGKWYKTHAIELSCLKGKEAGVFIHHFTPAYYNVLISSTFSLPCTASLPPLVRGNQSRVQEEGPSWWSSG